MNAQGSGQPVVLQYGVLKNNFEAYKRWISDEACHRFGDAGRFIDLGKYYEPEAIPPPAVGAAANEVASALYLEECKSRAKHIAEMRTARTSLYAFIKQTLSDESAAQVELADDWTEIRSSKDPLRLWKRIEVTHVGAGTVKHPLVLRDLRQQYRHLGQGPSESLSAFKRRYEDLRSRLRAVGDKEPEERDSAIELVHMLDDGRFWLLKSELENSVYTGTSKYPATIAGVFELAAEYRAPAIRRIDGEAKPSAAVAAAPGVATAAAAPGATTVFLASAEETKGDGGGGTATTAQGAATAQGAGGDQPQDRQRRAAKRQVGSRYVCAICDAVGKHWTDKCPKLERVRKLLGTAEEQTNAAWDEEEYTVAF